MKNSLQIQVIKPNIDEIYKEGFEFLLGFAKKRYKKLGWFCRLPDSKKLWFKSHEYEEAGRQITDESGEIWYLNVCVDCQLRVIWKMKPSEAPLINFFRKLNEARCVNLTTRFEWLEKR